MIFLSNYPLLCHGLCDGYGLTLPDRLLFLMPMLDTGTMAAFTKLRGGNTFTKPVLAKMASSTRKQVNISTDVSAVECLAHNQLTYYQKLKATLSQRTTIQSMLICTRCVSI